MRIRERFNPRAPCGARPAWRSASLLCVRFQPTRPLRGATAAAKRAAHERPISTHAPLAGRDVSCRSDGHPHLSISTHAPLAGRDLAMRAEERENKISTHAPLAGRDKTYLRTNP